MIALRAAKQQAGKRPLLHFLRHEADPAVEEVVNLLEKRIRESVPQAKHLDLEAE